MLLQRSDAKSIVTFGFGRHEISAKVCELEVRTKTISANWTGEPTRFWFKPAMDFSTIQVWGVGWKCVLFPSSYRKQVTIRPWGHADSAAAKAGCLTYIWGVNFLKPSWRSLSIPSSSLFPFKDFYRAAAMRNPALNIASKLFSLSVNFPKAVLFKQ